MTTTLGTSVRQEAGPARPSIRITPAAIQLLEQLRTEGGDVALFLAPYVSDEVLCLGRRDVTLGPNDLLIGTVHGCPVYVDRRATRLTAIRALVLDAESSSPGARFVFRVPAR